MSDESETLSGIPQPEMPKKEPPPESQQATYVVPPEVERSETEKLAEAAAAQTVAIPAHEIPAPDAATVEIVHKEAESLKSPVPSEEAATVEIIHKEEKLPKPLTPPEEAATVEIIHKEEKPQKPPTPPEEALTVEISQKRPPVPAAEAMTVAISHAEKTVEPPMPQPKMPVKQEPEASYSAATVEIIQQKEPVRVMPVTPEVIESAPPAKKSRKTLWIILIVVLLLLCCCAVIIVIVVTSGMGIVEWFNQLMSGYF